MNEYSFGICDWLLPIPGPISFELAAAAGYDGIQILDWGGRENNYPLNTTWIQDKFRKVMDETGVVIQTLQLQSLVRNGSIKADPSSYIGQLALEDIQHGAEACALLNIPFLQVENFFDSSITGPEDIRNTAALLKQAGRITSDYGVQLVYESWFDHDGTMEIYEMADQSFKLCYDTLNPLRYHFGDPLDDLQKYDHAMFAFVHVKDSPAGYKGSVCLGTGAGLINESCQILKERGYQGWIVTENYYCMDPIGKEDPKETSKKDLETLRGIFSARQRSLSF